jgi:uncharacterized protein (UPF0332 family)
MTFIWNDYIDLAEKLLGETDDASKRSAISRAYYGAYHISRQYLKDKKGNIPDSTYHKATWEMFDGPGAPREERAISINGDRIRLARGRADYENVVSGLKDQADDAVRRAKSIVKKIEAIVQK